ncbi:hypothetical protein A678_03943 [Salmonella enterica subsp. enterica serovar Enteritidis str. 2010K-0271]|nr:hypothetical protein A672_03688 [Salmonella enterica subsp. enterica serovar Enteritidis str. 08-1080]EPI94387.1 hypothetical protein A678_03943 [Salmonella enterica subsp. enterica serovar Enteritidis str. 2010K-0271]
MALTLIRPTARCPVTTCCRAYNISHLQKPDFRFYLFSHNV